MTRGGRGDRTRPGTGLSIASLALALVATVVVLFAPLSVSVTREASVPGQAPRPLERVERHRLLDTEGWSIMGVLAFPIGFAALPLPFTGTRAWRASRIAAAVLLTGFSFLAMFSVGWAYLPAAVAMWIAAAMPRREHAEPSHA